MVDAIIPSLCSDKSYPMLKRCIECLRASAKMNNINIKIVVVSNGGRYISKKIDHEVDLLVKVKNPYSFAKMNNIAIERSLLKHQPDWILLINDDAYVKNTFFKYFRLLALNAHKHVDIVVPLIYKHRGPTIDSFGIEYFCSGHAKNSPNIKFKTQLAPGACLLLNANLLKQMKSKYGFYFNNILVSYFEDVEFSIRAIAIGATVIKVKEMIAYHEVSYTNGYKSNYVLYQTFRNLIWLIIMTWPLGVIIKNIFNIFIGQCLMFIISMRTMGPLLYIKIWPKTLMELQNLLRLRRRITGLYTKDFNFEKMLLPLTLRTNNGVKIKFLKIASSY